MSHPFITHLPTLLLSTLTCHILFTLTPIIFHPSHTYQTCPPRRKIDWAIRVVSFGHALFAVGAASVLLGDEVLSGDKLFGYTWKGGFVAAGAAGYFLWDTITSARYASAFGKGFLIHASACLFVFTTALTPFLLYFAAPFLLYEVSTIFLNILWWMERYPKTRNSIVQMITALALMGSYAVFRLGFGMWYSWEFFETGIQRHTELNLPLFSLYAIANVTLNGLNIFWFSKMIRSFGRKFIQQVPLDEVSMPVQGGNGPARQPEPSPQRSRQLPLSNTNPLSKPAKLVHDRTDEHLHEE